VYSIKIEKLYKNFPSGFSLFTSLKKIKRKIVSSQDDRIDRNAIYSSGKRKKNTSVSTTLINFFKEDPDKEILKDINLEVKSGEIFAIVGPNGVGKTTLIKILCGLILPTSGNTWVCGYDIVKDEYKVKSRIGLVTGYERSFYWRLTGRQNLHFFAKLYGLSKLDIIKRINELSSLLDIEEELDKRFQKCSSGFKQRLAIARGLLSNPEVLFMDEPTRSLDPVASKNLRIFIKEDLCWRQKRTIFFSTHDLYEAEFLADRIALIHKGRIIDSGTLQELRSNVDKDKATLEEIFEYYISNYRPQATGYRKR